MALVIRKPEIEFTESNIISSVLGNISFRNQFDLITTNCYTQVDNEADIFCIKKSGICEEFEIKTTKSDFNNDAKKTVTHYEYCEYKFGEPLSDKCNKHSLLKSGGMASNYFWFVVPEGLISVDEISEKFGLYYVSKTGRLIMVKPAERLHARKLSFEYRYFVSKKQNKRHLNLIRKLKS